MNSKNALKNLREQTNHGKTPPISYHVHRHRRLHPQDGDNGLAFQVELFEPKKRSEMKVIAFPESIASYGTD